jgi:hypothetical protein
VNTFKAVVTAVLMVVFAVFIAFLLSEVGVKQASWERYVYLLSGVEAIVFAAVGWLFGKEVHREQAEKAEAKTEVAESRTDTVRSEHLAAVREAAKERTKGLALASAIATHATAAPAPLVELAKKEYPEAATP